MPRRPSTAQPASGRRVPEAVTTLGPELSQQEQEQLNLGLEALGLAQAGAAAAPSYGKYLGYVSLIRKWNKAMNLVSRQDVERLPKDCANRT